MYKRRYAQVVFVIRFRIPNGFALINQNKGQFKFTNMKCKRDEQLIQKSKRIGRRIRWLRYQKNFSLKEIAALLDMSVPALSKIEHGTTDMNLSRLMQIADLFKVSATELIADEPGVKAEDVEKLALREKLSHAEQEVIRLQRRLVELYEGLEKYITSK